MVSTLEEKLKEIEATAEGAWVRCTLEEYCPREVGYLIAALRLAISQREHFHRLLYSDMQEYEIQRIAYNRDILAKLNGEGE